MLVIALIAVIAANVFLYIIGADYNHDYKSAPRAPRAAQVQPLEQDGFGTAGYSILV